MGIWWVFDLAVSGSSREEYCWATSVRAIKDVDRPGVESVCEDIHVALSGWVREGNLCEGSGSILETF